jgi:hypothetical protein
MSVVTVAFLIVALVNGISANVLLAAHNETRALSSGCVAPDWHFDYPGNDIHQFPAASYEACCTECQNMFECGAYTWSNYNGGTCYLKWYHSTTEWKGALPDGSASIISSDVYRCGALTKGMDFEGADYFNKQAPRPESCCQYCVHSRFCVGFSWTNFNGGTCWFKQEGLKAVASPGAYAAYARLG